ncbi:ABC transporter ATP-binding protein [Microbacterium sp. SORGH_AS_0888]|uniref:ABC transporter ATP-binding protein n=1 Tax=Microbacterium sp. SORGH_AS_0888 TaxID=3041791 RepID=UPI0027849EB5|nr:ABC transporter ATP-binding protein [Microbacterium sp. SORGH_AS_0888]MDQ1131272.1 NitT/TauT family transport system ATP-binding protein [Microbacterium sp. SORGH_AS_0888]
MDITVDRVSKSYGATLALSETSFRIAQNEFVTIVGPSGCGKSTLLMMMAGLLPTSTGSIRLDEQEVRGPAHGVGVVFQDYSRSLFPWMTVKSNLAMAMVSQKLPKGERDARIARALHSVGLEGHEKTYPWQMSGGMQQRVAIARAVVALPRILLMDEPFAAVDAQTRADLEDLILRIRDEYRVTVALVTHDIDESVYLADRVLVLAAGPGRVIRDLPVDLPSPREQVATKRLPAFVDYRSTVFELVMRPVAKETRA